MGPRLSDVLQNEHREIELYYDRIIAAVDELERREYRNQFTWYLARHAIGEELVVYPAYEKYISDGGVALANKDRQQHQAVRRPHPCPLLPSNTLSQVKEQLKIFQNMEPSDKQFIPTLKTLMNELFQHMKEEEQHDLPALEQYLSQAESESYSKSFGRTKMFVPSRSHPKAPNKPPFETAVGLLTAPIDLLADLFREWPDTSSMDQE